MWLIFLIKLFVFQNISIAWHFSETPDIILKKTTGLSLGNESSDCHYNQPIKRSLSNYFKFFKIHSYNLREITNITRSIISSLDILSPSKISWLWNKRDKVQFCWHCLVVDLIQTSRDRKSSRWAIFAYFTFSFSLFAISAQSIG